MTWRAGGLVVIGLVGGCASVSVAPTALEREPPRLLSAFFGLDGAMPETARGLCWGAPGQDGMPVTLSRRVVAGRRGAVSAEAFVVTTRSGARKTPRCATTAPANGPGEGHTVLLIGELGDARRDPPVRVDVTGALALEGGANARGLSVAVTPLEDGPSLVLALGYAPGALPSDCPARTRQVVVVVWAGGVRPVASATQEDHRKMYAVTTSAGQVTPFALGDLGDRDNYVHLCLDTSARALRVDARAGVVMDPRDDANPATSAAVSR